jgi:hypothetical protein
MTTESLSPQFTDGFVKSCLDHGLNMEQTESAYRIHALNYLLSTPGIYGGFREKLATYRGALTKSAMSRYLTPEILALTAECRIKYADDALSIKLRSELGLPAPSWETVDPEIQKIASSLSDTVSHFEAMPLNQKVLLASMVGSGMGGLSRLARPTADDQYNQRGALNRTFRGIGRGAATGAGFAAGAEAGGSLTQGLGHGGATVPGMLAGGAAGALAAHRLTE